MDKYLVIELFEDDLDGKRLYRVGDVYPREGLVTTEARIKQLMGLNKYGKTFLQKYTVGTGVGGAPRPLNLETEMAVVRGPFDTVEDRLEADRESTKGWLNNNIMSQTEFDSWVATLLDGGPSIFMDSLAMLQSTYPTGASGVALVRETDPAKLYAWNNGTWEFITTYVPGEIRDDSVTKPKLDFIYTPNPVPYIAGHISGGIIPGGGTTAKYETSIPNARSVIFEVESNTTYTISKELSDRFRIALKATRPVNAGESFTRMVKGDVTTPDESLDKFFTFKTNATEKFVMVTVSLTGKEPRIVINSGANSFNFDEIIMKENIKAPNITQGKNLFNGEYVVGAVAGSVYDETANYFRVSPFPNARTYIMPVENFQDYSIYKTLSNRFRVGLSVNYPADYDPIKVLKDETVGNGDSDNEFTLNTSVFNFLLVTVCNIEVDVPDFVQIEKGSAVTELENFGYKFFPEAKPIVARNGSDVLSVEDFRAVPLTDRGVIQRAFDAATNQVVSFQSGREYKLDNTVIAKANKVIGILGNNALLTKGGTDGLPALIYEGSKTRGNAMPNDPTNAPLFKTEMNAFLEQLRVTSDTPFINDGILIRNMSKPRIHAVFIFKTKNGLTFKGYNRDVIISDPQIYDNAENGLFFDRTNIHQINLEGGHISYNKNDIKFVDSNIANVIFNGSSVENGNAGDGYENSESLITFEETLEGTSIYEVILLNGCNLQEHGNNTKPLVNVSVTNGQIYDFNLNGGIVGNCSSGSVPVKIKKAHRVLVNGTDFPSNQGESTVVLEGAVSGVRILGSSFNKKIDYENAIVGSMIIANNTTSGLYDEDSKIGNVLIANNL